MFLGIDTGGTFTDFILYENGKIRQHKQLSTPDDPSSAILEGIAALGDADVERLGGLMPVYPGRIRDDDWVGQARHLLAGDGA